MLGLNITHYILHILRNLSLQENKLLSNITDNQHLLDKSLEIVVSHQTYINIVGLQVAEWMAHIPNYVISIITINQIINNHWYYYYPINKWSIYISGLYSWSRVLPEDSRMKGYQGLELHEIHCTLFCFHCQQSACMCQVYLLSHNRTKNKQKILVLQQCNCNVNVLQFSFPFNKV